MSRAESPEKQIMEAGLGEEITYTKELLKALEEGIAACGNRRIQELSREMKELPADEKIRDPVNLKSLNIAEAPKYAASALLGASLGEDKYYFYLL